MKNNSTGELLFLILISLSGEINAQNPVLVADLKSDTLLADISDYSMIQFNNSIYFNAIDNSGMKLWKSDGTETGTFKAIDPPVQTGPIELNGSLIYGSMDGYSGTALWKSDGTGAGTSILKHIEADCFVNLNGTIYFRGTDLEHGSEIWKTDGTQEGTQLVLDLNPGIESSSPFQQAAVLDGKIVFTTLLDGAGESLYITDGTAPGTMLLKVVSPDETLMIKNLLVFDNDIYFMASTEADGQSLWKTDGTESGTVMVKDFDPTLNQHENWPLYTSDGKMYMLAVTVQHGRELWVSNGSAEGTKLSKNISPGAQDAFESYHTNALWPVGKEIYFLAEDASGFREPWRSNGSSMGTVKVKAFESSATQSQSFFIQQADYVIFPFYHADKTILYATDGTAAGTQMLTSVSSPNGPAMLSNKIYIKDTNLDVLWHTDGTAAGTDSFSLNTHQTGSSFPESLIGNSSGYYLFTTHSDYPSADHHEIYSTRVLPGTTLKLLPDGYDVISLCPLSVGSLGFFSTENYGGIEQLFVTDGTVEGTSKIADISTTFSGGTAVLENVLYFISGSFDLWRSDGTEAGTFNISDVSNGGADDGPHIAACHEMLYLGSKNTSTGNEIWQSNGTTPGTVLLKDIKPGDESSNASGFICYDEKIVFSATEDENGREPYISDGTTSGTVLLKNIRSGKTGSFPDQFTQSGDYLFFVAEDKEHGTELWRTDGTTEGTALAEDLRPGNLDTDIFFLTDVNGTLFYLAGNKFIDGEMGIRSISGTDTASLEVIKGLNPSSFTNVDGDLYFVNEGILWRTDGNPCRTEPIDFYPEVADEAVKILYVDGNEIFLSLNSADYGVELFRYTTSPITNVETCNGLDDDCNGLVDDDPIAIINPSGIITACKGEAVLLVADAGVNLIYQWSKNGNALAGETGYAYSTTKEGSFSVMVSNDSGCESISAITEVERTDNPQAIITAMGNLDICLEGFVDLQANAGTGYQYRWFRKNKILNGATNQIYAAAKTGDYKVEVTDSNGCIDFSKKVTVIHSCERATEIQFPGAKAELYPNPAHQILYFNLEREQTGMIVISNLLGKILYTQPAASSEMILDISSWSAGIYILEWRSRDEAIVKHFLKQ